MLGNMILNVGILVKTQGGEGMTEADLYLDGLILPYLQNSHLYKYFHLHYCLLTCDLHLSL